MNWSRRLISSSSTNTRRLLLQRQKLRHQDQAQRQNLWASSYKCLSTNSDAKSSNNNNESNPEQLQSLEQLRTSILRSALREVQKYGWSEDALAAAAATNTLNSASDQSMSLSVAGMITTDDLIGFCMDQWNLQLKEDLQLQQSQQPQDEVEETSTDHLLMNGLKTRLEYAVPYLKTNRWHEAMALGIRGPSNAMQTRQQLEDMIEIVVNSTTDANHTLGTTEKMALGAVYVTTELHLLTDNSPGYQDTWSFLELRMQDWRLLVSLNASTISAATLPLSILFRGAGDSNNIKANSTMMGAEDSLFVVSSVASSLVGGFVSLIVNPSPTAANSFGLPDIVWNSLFRNQQPTNWRQPASDMTTAAAGSHPSHYDVPTDSSSTPPKHT